MGGVRRTKRQMEIAASRQPAGESGQGLVEYALILGLVTLAVVGTLSPLGLIAAGFYSSIAAIPWP